MATDKGLDFFYDQQIRRYLLQFIRIFTAFQYQTGKDANGNVKQRQIPAHYAYRDRMVSHILRNNSENVILSTPFITGWIRDISMARNRTQNPNFVGKLQVYERDINEDTGKYTGEPGDTYTVQRFMPVPYDLTMQVDIWTTNEQQKHQLMEQILVLFNPALEIQSSTNPLDWTALTYVELNDVTWSSRSIPVGTEDEIDVATLTFTVPIWINPAAKVQRQNIINVIRTNLQNSVPEEGNIISTAGDEGDLGQIVTRGWNVLIQQVDDDFEVTLLDEFNNETDNEGKLYNWSTDVFGPYGKLRSGATQLRLITTKDIDAEEKDIVGTLQPATGEPNKLIWDPNPMTLPLPTLDEINGIIDPHSVWPGEGLKPADDRQRYLILEDIYTKIIKSISWSETGKTCAFGTTNNEILLYNTSEPYQINYLSPSHILHSHPNDTIDAIQLRNNRIFVLTRGKYLRSIDIANDEIISSKQLESDTKDFSLSNEGLNLFTTTTNGVLRKRDLSSAYDLNTVSSIQQNFNTNTNNTKNLFVDNDASLIYLSAVNTLYRYTFTTKNDLSSISLDDDENLSSFVDIDMTYYVDNILSNSSGNFTTPLLFTLNENTITQYVLPSAGILPGATVEANQTLEQTSAWGSLTAGANDIIMYDGAQWTIAFDSSQETNTQYVTNKYTNKQLKWNGTEWVFTIDGLYREGEFRIRL